MHLIFLERLRFKVFLKTDAVRYVLLIAVTGKFTENVIPNTNVL